MTDMRRPEAGLPTMDSELPDGAARYLRSKGLSVSETRDALIEELDIRPTQAEAIVRRALQ